MNGISFASQINYTRFFNNKNLSDCQILFTQSNTTLFSHKFILMASSDFFRACFELDVIESREGIVRIDQEDDEKLLTDLIKSLYTCHLVIEDKKDIVPTILLAQKYQLNELIPILTDHLISNMDRSNVLQCLHLDLENEQFKQVKQIMQQQLAASSDEILKGDSYLTLNVDEWICALEMLVHKGNALDVVLAINSWVEVDVEDRAQYCYALNSAVKKVVQINPNNKSNGVSFDPLYTGSRATLSEDKKRIKKSAEDGYNCAALGTKCDSFSIRLIKNCANMMIGMAPRTINKDGENFNCCGWYLYCVSGNLYSQSGAFDESYHNKTVNQNGTVIGVSLENGEMSFSVNGQDLGVAFRDLHGLDLYPAFDISYLDCEFEFV